MAKGKPKYFVADQSKLQQKLDELGTGTFFKPKEGKNTVRILPPWSDSGLWYKEATMHYGLANLEGKERAQPCLKMFGNACPVCEARMELEKGTQEDKKAADRIRPRTKYYTNILEGKSGKVMIWGFTPKTLGILLSYCSDPDYGDISHPEEGFDVVIERQGTTRTDTKYQIRLRPKATAIEVEGWDAQMHNLDAEVVDEMEYDELLSIVESNFGTVKATNPKEGEETDDDDEDDD